MFFYFYCSIWWLHCVNNWGSGQYNWPLPLINLTAHSSSQLSPAPNHLISATLTILDLKACFHITEQPYTAPLPISTLQACQPPAPLSSLGFMASPTLLIPSNKKAAIVPLYLRIAIPAPLFWAPPQQGRRRSWVGINTGSSSHRLCAPSNAQSSSPLSLPTPRPPPNSDMHNHFFFFFFSSQFYSPLGRSPMSDVTTT